MPLVKRLTQMGPSSRGVVLPKPFIDQLALDDPNAEVEISLEGDRIVIEPHRYATKDEARASARRMMTKHRKSLERLAR